MQGLSRPTAKSAGSGLCAEFLQHTQSPRTRSICMCSHKHTCSPAVLTAAECSPQLLSFCNYCHNSLMNEANTVTNKLPRTALSNATIFVPFLPSASYHEIQTAQRHLEAAGKSLWGWKALPRRTDTEMVSIQRMCHREKTCLSVDVLLCRGWLLCPSVSTFSSMPFCLPYFSF